MKQGIVLTFLLMIAWGTFASDSKFEYLFPIPGTALHSKNTDIIIRPGYSLSQQDINKLESTKVIGSVSGSHDFKATLVENSRTIVFDFDQPFLPGEEIEVIFDTSFRGFDLNPIGTFDYHFSISASKKYVSDFDWSNKEVFATQEKDTDSLPPGFPVIDIQIPGATYDAEIFITPTSSSYDLIILKEDGFPEYVNNNLNGFITNLQMQQGLLTFAQVSGPPKFLVMDSAYQFVDTLQMQNGLTTDTHELILKSNGSFYGISYDQEIIDMSQLVPGGNPQANVTGVVIQEVDPNNNVLFEWRSWDHFDIMDAVHNGTDSINFTAQNVSYVHCNSIEIDPNGDLIISNRNMNEVTKISRTTGDIIWRMGGKNNQFTFIDDFPYGFTAQHDARLRPNGNLTLFDNGYFHQAPETRVVEYELDEVNLTATLVREIVSPIGVPSIRTGNAQSLPNGNLFIGWGRPDASGTFIAAEYDQNDNIVFQLTTLQGGGFGYSYRAFKYPWRPEVVTSLSNIVETIDFSIFPNPTSGNIKINFGERTPENTVLMVSDVTGRLIQSQHIPSGIDQLQLGMDVKQGVYLLSIDANGQIGTKKLIISE
ncbi:MAG: arylsulfotransferase family protein [Bacteroidota bacterium]